MLARAGRLEGMVDLVGALALALDAALVFVDRDSRWPKDWCLDDLEVGIGDGDADEYDGWNLGGSGYGAGTG